MKVTVQNTSTAYLPELHTADEVSRHIKGYLSAARILQLAEAGYFPCWRIDDGPPMFVYKEARDYIAKHLLRSQAGAPFPKIIPVPVLPLRATKPPPALAHIAGLRCFSESVYPPCVYFLLKQGEIQYIGQTVNISTRTVDHRRSGKEFDEVFFLPVPEEDLDAVESAFIRVMKPYLSDTVSRSDDGTDLEWLKKYDVNVSALLDSQREAKVVFEQELEELQDEFDDD